MSAKIIILCTLLKVIYSKECLQSITTVSGYHVPAGRICSGDLIFEENFNIFHLDVWKHEQTLGGGSGNNQFQWYTNNRNNSYVEDGILHIRPTLLADERGADFLYTGTLDIGENCTDPRYDGCLRKGTKKIILNPIKSARINTQDSFAFKYGRVEVRAKIAVGDWLWPALWMKPKRNKYSDWPISGEVDIVECRGNRQFFHNHVNTGSEQIGFALHWGLNSSLNRYTYTFFTENKDDGWNQFHVYELKWTAENISFYIDKKHLGTVIPPNGGFWELGKFNSTRLSNPWINGTKLAPFDDEFFFIINMAVGSTTFFPDAGKNEPYEKPWKNSRGRASLTDFWKSKEKWLPTWNITTDSGHFQIDYIKVWAL